VLTYSQDYYAESAGGGDNNEEIVEEFHGLQDLIKVSPRWGSLIETNIGISLVFGNNGDHDENNEESNILLMTEIGVAKCKILPSFRKPRSLVVFPKFKYPNLLRTLKINSHKLYQEDFENLLTGVRNLNTLILSSRTYSNFHEVSDMQPLDLPHLRRLTLGKYRDETSLPHRWFNVTARKTLMRISGLAELLRLFAASSLPLLDHFHLCASAMYMHNEDLAMACLLNFLLQHEQSLRHLRISFTDVDKYEHLLGLEEEERTNQTLIQPPSQEIEAIIAQMELHLTTFTIELFPCTETMKWAYFIGDCEKIADKLKGLTQRHTIYPYFTQTAAYAQFIQNNQDTLTHLTLTVSHINCGILTRCPSLLKLTLVGNTKMMEEYETENFRGVPGKSEVEQLELLPNSLERIMIEDLFISSTELATLNFSKFPKLRNLILYQTGDKEEFGMTLNELYTIVGTASSDTSKVFYLRITRGINRHSVQAGTKPASSSCNASSDMTCSHLHVGSEMLTNLALQGAFRFGHARQEAGVYPHRKFLYMQNTHKNCHDSEGEADTDDEED